MEYYINVIRNQGFQHKGKEVQINQKIKSLVILNLICKHQYECMIYFLLFKYHTFPSSVP